MDPTKVEGIKNWPRLMKVKDTQSSLGFCNFYHPFIPSVSKIAKPLNKLEKTNTKRHLLPYKASNKQTSTMTTPTGQTI